jgi:hypothetical protein
MLVAAVAAEVLAVVLLVLAYVSRTDPPPFEGQTGRVEELLDEFSMPARPEFTTTGVALLTLAAASALLGAALFLAAFRRR